MRLENTSSDAETVDTSKALVTLLRGYGGGIGNYLTPEQKEHIAHGRKNVAENISPYNYDKLSQAADDFFAVHPLSTLERCK